MKAEKRYEERSPIKELEERLLIKELCAVFNRHMLASDLAFLSGSPVTEIDRKVNIAYQSMRRDELGKACLFLVEADIELSDLAYRHAMLELATRESEP
jgi:hypothetical protein